MGNDTGTDPNRPEYSADWQAFGCYRRWGQQPDADGQARANSRDTALAHAILDTLEALGYDSYGLAHHMASLARQQAEGTHTQQQG